MATTFLIGGTGNQLFEYVTSSKDDNFSTFFLNNSVRSLLGWTKHEQILEFDAPNILVHTFLLIVLSLDLLLAKYANVSLFSDLDLIATKKPARIFKLVRMGYFQDAKPNRDIIPIKNKFFKVRRRGLIVAHIRGGDLLRTERVKDHTYGLLPKEYFHESVSRAVDLSRRQFISSGLSISPNKQSEKILVLTDDPEYAAEMMVMEDASLKIEVSCLALADTLEIAVNADWYISSNSTMSYWIVRMRDGTNCFAPQPFQKRGDFKLPESTLRISVNYNC